MTRKRTQLVLQLAAGLACVVACAREPAASAVGIPEHAITELQKDLAEAGRESSSTRKRRTYKNVVRDGEDLLEASPEAPNRWHVLEIIFQGQKRLLGLENSERNREALLATSSKLVEAPDELADLRLEADMLLSERDLSAKNADVKKRAAALGELIARYRDTPGEAKCLMMAALIAPKLEAFDLEDEIERTLCERFAGDLDVIEWRRKYRDFSHLPVQFAGTFKRADGMAISFPADRMAHTSVMFFWSKKTPQIELQFEEIKDLQGRFPGQFKVYSFNLDELPDAGESVLRARGTDWTALHLPGGRKSQLYRAYASQDPVAIRVNAHGHAFVSASQTRIIAEEAPMEQNFDELRYHAQLQSLFIGDFMVTRHAPAPVKGTDPDTWFREIEDCFVPAPLRYRLSRSQALANYEKAERLCRESIAEPSRAPDLWRVRNCRIIALLGMWNLANEPKHLEDAVKEAQAALAAGLSRGTEIVSRFCLAKDALRRGGSNPRVLLTEWVKALGGDDASASAYAAAAILALEANARDMHETFRERVLETHVGTPALWPVVSFLVDQNHRYRLFKPNLYLPPSKGRRIERARLRGNAVAFDAPQVTDDPLEADFDTIDGGKLSLAQATDGKLTLLMFVEASSGSESSFPTLINGSVTEDARGKKVETLGVMQHAFAFADQHVREGIQVVAAFLSDDSDRVRALMDQHGWPCEAIMVPGGLTNPLVRRLGILSADRVPNIVLLRPDGTILWTLSGIVHPQVRSEGIGETLHVIGRAMKSHIDAYEMEGSLRVFEKGDFEEAIDLFAGWFPQPERPNPDEWTAPRLHGRALAQMKLKNWETALADLDAAIVAHQRIFNAGQQCVCQRVAQLQLTRATVLDELGRPQEAKHARESAAAARTAHGPSRAGRLHDRLEAMNKEGSAACE